MTVASIYRQLFGRKGPAEGTVIDMAEHGRSGGLSTKQGFKYVGDIKEAIRVAEKSTDSNITYVGKAAIGSATDAARWQIMSIDETSGTVVTFADGDDNYDNIWDSREELSYS